MATAAAPKYGDRVVNLQVDEIDPSPTNPRKTFDEKKLDELAESIKKRGLLHPVTVRPVGTRFELVVGERRRRACVLAGLDEIPAFVRDLSDDDVLEVQLIENAQREDVLPLEEADGYKLLQDRRHYTVEEIAQRVGKSPKTVHERLQLVKLCAEARKALEEDRLLLGVAVLISRIPGEDLQKRATQRLSVRKGDQPCGHGAAAETIQNEFMHGLKDAPFDKTDAALVPAAGACSTCPKRTGNQRELFADVKSPDICTDPKCYRAKEDALWQLKVHKAKETGQKVLGAAEAKKLYPYGDHSLYGNEYVDGDNQVCVGDKWKPAKSIIGKDAKTVLVRTPQEGRIVELIPREVLEKARRAAIPKGGDALARAQDASVSMETQNRRKLELRKATVQVATPKIVEVVENSPAEAVLRFIAVELIHGGHHEDVQALGKRRGLETRKRTYGGPSYDKAIEDLIAASEEPALCGIIVELLIGGNAAGGTYSSSFSSPFERGAKFAHVDLKKLQAQAKKEKDAAKKAKGKKKPAQSRKEA